MEAFCLNINGEERSIYCEKNWNLLYVLREVLDLTGAKCGCNTGDCGACRVIIDGEAVNSCLYQVQKLEGKKIVTIEGVRGEDGGLHHIQQAFIDAGAVQCGYCTPGMVLSTKALLDKNPSPSEEEILEAINPNLCRCTGYVKILDAVRLAVSYIKEGA